MTVQDRIERMDNLSGTLKAKIERLTVQNAGLRAHNEALQHADSGIAQPHQASAFHHRSAHLHSPLLGQIPGSLIGQHRGV